MATTTTIEKYGVPISLEIQRAVTSKKKKIVGLVYPLVQDATRTISGGVVRSPANQGNYINSGSGKSLIRNNLRQLLSTQKGERIMLPDYGLSMHRFLFEPLDQTLFYLIRREVILNITKYFKQVKILNIAVVSSPREQERSILRIDLTLQLLDQSLDIFDVQVAVG
tara:strand:+ start:18544 stop:19044 length:501 start_codon:yes stop_codon:yes gene_type:complete